MIERVPYGSEMIAYVKGTNVPVWNIIRSFMKDPDCTFFDGKLTREQIDAAIKYSDENEDEIYYDLIKYGGLTLAKRSKD